MLEDMMKIVMENKIKTEYPQLLLPVAAYAKVTKVQEFTDYALYNLKLLDENRNIDTRYPELPDTRSGFGLESGDIVTVLLMYGQLQPYIVGKVI